MTNFTATNLTQIVAATESLASKMATTSVARFGKILNLRRMDYMVKKVWQDKQLRQ
jgi:hypothetical protein